MPTLIHHIVKTATGLGYRASARAPLTKLVENIVLAEHIDANTVDKNFFVAHRALRIVSVTEAHAVAGNDVGAVTLAVKKCTATQAPSAGTAVHTGTADLKGAANTVQTLTLSATPADLTLAAGDRLAIDVTGTLTTLAGGIVVVALRPI